MAAFPFFEFKWIGKEELWQIVDDFSKKYWSNGKIPVDMEKIVEQKLSLNIEPMPSLFKEHHIDAYLRMDLTGIVVDLDCLMDDRFSNRVRFTFAHEIGHYVLHKDVIEQIGMATSEDWKSYVMDLVDREYKGFEWQANEFAGRLLVPPQKLEAEIKNFFKSATNDKLLDHLKTAPEAVLAQVSDSLSESFGVSGEVIEKRIEREGLWPPK